MTVRPIDLTNAAWRKSSYSNSDGGECVEIATNLPAALPVRDSKNPHGPALLLPRPAWTAFVTALKNDLPGSV
ncbi:DUF397 domain-containing protein [Streptomyces montanisoli]|uniref:DUF397 domain-containing protein n=1 Tax=Streptomyces montanisoli TaxID=2798581 RepID=A0A940RZX1_9ACTN|nr:DUF397 domain-containing protein [Streptomyces montanisoli]MBP0460688.1 DUF397 domain-containing protein [Streptomyces montanisoli]